jgi:hypothetical protein
MDNFVEEDLNNKKTKINTYLNTLIPVITKLEPLYTELPQLFELKKSFEDLKVKTNEFRFLRIPILGVIKAGKSSLINSLLHSEILEIGPIIATKFLLIIRYTDQKSPSLYHCKSRRSDILNESYVTVFETEGEPVAQGILDIKNYIKSKNEEMIEKADDEAAELDSFFMILKMRVPFLERLPKELRDIVELMDCPGLNDAKARLLDKELLRNVLSPYNSFLYVIKPDTSESKENRQTFNNILSNVGKVANPSYEVQDDKNTYIIVLNQMDNVNEDREKVISKISNFLTEKFCIKYTLIPYSSREELQKYDYYAFLKVQYNYYEKNKIYYDSFIKYLEDRDTKTEELIKQNNLSIEPINEDDLISDTFCYKDQVMLEKNDLIRFSKVWKVHSLNDEENELADTLVNVIKNQNGKSLTDIFDLVKSYKIQTFIYLESCLNQKSEEFGKNKLEELKVYADEFSQYVVNYKTELYGQIEIFKKQIDRDMGAFNDHFFEQTIEKIKEGIENLNITYTDRLEQHRKNMNTVFDKYNTNLGSEYKKLNRWCKNLEKELIFEQLPDTNPDQFSVIESYTEDAGYIDFHPMLIQYTGYVMGAAVLLGSRIVLASPISMLGSAVFSYEVAKKVLKEFIGFDFKEDKQRGMFKESISVQKKEFEDVINKQKEEVKEYTKKVLRDYKDKFMGVKRFLEIDRKKIKENIEKIKEVIDELNKIIVE